MTTIEAKSPGPIEGVFEIDLSPGFGAYEFRGSCGSGKTTLLNSIDLLTGHRVDITLHDGEMSGHVKGFGVTAPIGSRKRRKGNLEVETLETEKFTPGDIIDPDGKTPEVRDARRIKALASLSGAKADSKLYYEVTGGAAGFSQLAIDPTGDPVVLATRIKDKFDATAREQKRSAKAEGSHADVLEFVPDDLDIKNSGDLTVLGNVRDELRDNAERLRNERANGIQREQEIAEAKVKLGSIQTEYNGLTVEAATEAFWAAKEELDHATEAAKKLREQLRIAEEAVRDHESGVAVATERGKTAKQHEQAVSVLEETASQSVTYPAEEEIATAAEGIDKATDDYETGVRIRDVKANQARAAGHRKAEQDAVKQSGEAKNKAGEVFGILAKSLKTKHIRIMPVDGAPRLFVDHEKRGKCFFDKVNGLSDGERVRTTLLELLPHLGSPGVFPVPQRTWQDLQPADRAKLHELAKEKQLYVFGAQVTDGELRVKFMGE